MRLTGALIFAGAIASVSSILNYSCVDAQTNSTAASGRDASSKAAVAGTADTKDKNFGLNAVSKAIVDEASRLENDVAGWDRKMQELELDLNTSQQDDEATAKDVEESLLVLQAAAGRLGPDAEARVTLRKQEGVLRELASRAEVHSLPEIRKTAGYFQQKTTELHALNRSIEETRMGLMTQIDLLQELKVQPEFNRAAGQIGELVKRGEASLNSIQVIAAHAHQLANDLAGFGSTPAAAAQSADGTNPAQATKTPAAAAKPAEAHGRASRRAAAADAPGLAAVPGTLRAETAPAASASATQAGWPNTKETAPGFILLPSPSSSIDSAHRVAAPSSPKPAAANPLPTTRGLKVAPDGRL
jgi:cell division protein ZapA (FtsZ GTPase activity inhibitor)